MAGILTVLLAGGACLGFLSYGLLRRGRGARTDRKLSVRIQALCARTTVGPDLQGTILRHDPLARSTASRQLLALIPWLAVWEKHLRQIDSSGSLAGLIGVAAVCALCGMLAASVASAESWLLPVAAGAAAALPFFGVSVRSKRLADRFDAQLPDALELIGRSLQAGMTLPATLALAGEEIPAPLGPRFRQLSDELGHGASFGEALDHLAASAPSATLRFFVSAVAVQREVGGNLADLTINAAAAVRQRLQMDGKVQALTAEGRLSAVLLTALPLAMLALLSAINRDYVSVLWLDDTGRKILYAMLTMVALGNMMMRRMVRIDY